MADENENNAPSIISHFRLDNLLGSGGMGAVYRGIDRRDDTPVAIKLLHPHLADDSSFRERFEREAHVAALLRSPYTVHLLDYGISGRHYFIAMEFVDGLTLKDTLRDGPLAPLRALRIATQIARALEEAQARGVVHRDIKPENILIRGEDSVKVSDFGIARQVGTATITVTGAFIGTLSYAAPEQMLGRVDHRSDIYALGATLYHMLAGRPPFSGTIEEMLHLVREAPPPRQPLAGLPPRAVAIALRCLEKDPAKRYQSASELAAALTEAGRPGAGPDLDEETIFEDIDATVADGAVPVAVGQAVPVAPLQPALSLRISAPKTGLPLAARFASTTYDLIVRNEGSNAVVLALKATDQDNRCRFSLDGKISEPPRAVSRVPVKVSPAVRRWTGARQRRTFVVTASPGDGQPPLSGSAQFEDRPYGWLPLGGGLLSAVGAGAAALILTVLGGSSGGEGGGGPIAGVEPLTIGVLAPLTGDLASRGPAVVNAAQLAVDEINDAGGVLGRPVQLVQGDAGSNDPDDAARLQDASNEALRLIQAEGADVIIDSAASDVALKVAELATVADSILQISASSTSPDMTTAADDDFLFRTSLSDDAQGIALAELAREDEYSSVCNVFADEPYGQRLNNLFKAAAPGLTFVEVPHPRTQTTFAAALDLCAGTDAIAALTFANPAGFLLQEALDRGFSNFLFVDGSRDPGLFAAVGWESFDGMKGTDLGELQREQGDAFDASYSAAYGEPPPVPFLREVYDAVYLSALAAETAGSTDGTAMRDALRGAANAPGKIVNPGREGFQEAKGLIAQKADLDYDGASGPTNFDTNGDVLSGAVEVWRVNAARQSLDTERVLNVDLQSRSVLP